MRLLLRNGIYSSVVFALFSSCKSAPLDSHACSEAFQEWESRLGSHSEALEQWGRDRAPASIGSAFLTAEQRSKLKHAADPVQEEWMSRAERELKTAQRWIVRVEEDPTRRAAGRELQTLANRWVVFHGLAFQKRTREMRKELTDIRQRTARVRGLACESPADVR